MTEDKAPVAAPPAKALLALNPKEEAEFKKKVQEIKKRPSKGGILSPGVVYVGHLPSELSEVQLKTYFQQFGKVRKIRLAMSKKTGRSKGYAFLEYDCDEVAKIVAETMNNYLMGERLIKCHMLPPEKVHEQMFSGSSKRFHKPKFPAVGRYNKMHSAEDVTKMTRKLLRKESKLRKRLAASGIDYDFPGFAAQVPSKKSCSDGMNSSTCSEDATPVCTPSVLERRKSVVVTDDDVDDEIVVKMPAQELKDEDDASSEQEESNESDYEKDMAQSEEPSERTTEATEEEKTE